MMGVCKKGGECGGRGAVRECDFSPTPTNSPDFRRRRRVQLALDVAPAAVGQAQGAVEAAQLFGAVGPEEERRVGEG